MTTSPQPVLRPARSTDAGKIAEILHGFEVDTPWMPKQHTGAEAISFCGTMIDRGWVIIAQIEGRVDGFLARDGAEVCALYIRDAARGHGIGRALLNYAKSVQSPLQLWSFQANEGAQRFYLREGFVEQTRTDGATNGEGLPDIQYIWPAPKPEPKVAPKPAPKPVESKPDKAADSPVTKPTGSPKDTA
ncbi:GNAT family N-acetyltransferase [Phaeobacter sp. C3_T13_0]|uniref:GNAT family N-acetyltransferase n=1 Tax=Phaeobacter cretensis TaxID=3342641 RepID=UPI0039BD59DF